MDPEDLRPVIIGVGQVTHRPQRIEEIKTPLELILQAVRLAEEDAGLSGLVKKADTLFLVNIISETSEDPSADLARKIGIPEAERAYTWIGACAPQWFVNRISERIFEGRAAIGLICGGEALRSSKLASKESGGGRADIRISKKRPWMAGDLRDPLTALELKYGLVRPIHVYPLFENAMRHHRGQSIEEHRMELGTFCSRFSAIAERNPHAWFPERKTPEEIVTVTPDNRMVSFPYTKSMCTIIETDQAAAVFLTNVRTARDLGVPRHKWVFPIGGGEASDIWHVTERELFHASPSVKVAAEKAMEQAGVTLEDIAYFDFYSCFPCAPRITRDMLGIPLDDPRPLTVTGGMPYFGGPGNNYSLHAICRMAELIREDPGKTGLVQSLSWFISKHAVGIYTGVPKRRPWRPVPPERYQGDLDRLRGPELVEEASGPATVETFSMFHDRDGRPVNAVIVGRLDDGKRFLAHAERDEGILQAMMEVEFVGERGRVIRAEGANLFRF